MPVHAVGVSFFIFVREWHICTVHTAEKGKFSLYSFSILTSSVNCGEPLESAFPVGAFDLLHKVGNVASVHFREVDLALSVGLSKKCLSITYV